MKSSNSKLRITKKNNEIKIFERILTSKYSDPDFLPRLKIFYNGNTSKDALVELLGTAVDLQRTKYQNDLSQNSTKYINYAGTYLSELFIHFPELSFNSYLSTLPFDEEHLILFYICLFYRLSKDEDELIELAIDNVEDYYSENDSISKIPVEFAICDFCMFNYDLEMILLKNQITLSS